MKKKIVLELDNRYFSAKDLSNAVLHHFQNEGINCCLLNENTINIEGNIYSIMEWNVSPLFPVQQVILKLLK